MERSDLVEALASVLSGDPDAPVAAWLYGSRARGAARVDSDVDVAILTGGPRARRLQELPTALAGRLEDRVGLPVQIVVVDHAPVDLIHRILRDGIRLLDRDPAERVRFEVKARNQYFDLLPYLRQYRAAVLGRLS